MQFGVKPKPFPTAGHICINCSNKLTVLLNTEANACTTISEKPHYINLNISETFNINVLQKLPVLTYRIEKKEKI